MDQYHQNLIEIFKRYLSDNDITIISENNGYFELSNESLPDKIITALYVSSLPVNKSNHGSRHNTLVDTIARFQLPNYEGMPAPTIFAFPIHNPRTGKLNFALVPSKIVIERTLIKYQFDIIKATSEVIFWLMEDKGLYDCTDLSFEGEWFFMSKGINGRMADDTDSNYTEYFNNWDVFIHPDN